MSQRNLQITVHKQTLEWASESELNAANSCRYIQKNDCCLKKSILWNFIILLLRTSIAIKFFIFDIKWKWSCSVMSDVRLFVTAWTVAYQDPPSMGFSRQEYWSGLPFLSPGDLPDPGIHIKRKILAIIFWYFIRCQYRTLDERFFNVSWFFQNYQCLLKCKIDIQYMKLTWSSRKIQLSLKI